MKALFKLALIALLTVSIWSCDGDEDVSAPDISVVLSETEIDSGDVIQIKVVGPEDAKYVLWHGRPTRINEGQNTLRPALVYSDSTHFGATINPNTEIPMRYNAVGTWTVVAIGTRSGVGKGNIGQTIDSVQVTVSRP